MTGTLDSGKKCDVYDGIKSPYMDLGLIRSFPHTLSTAIAFDTVGTQFIHCMLAPWTRKTCAS